MKIKSSIKLAAVLIIAMAFSSSTEAQRIGTPFGLSAENPGLSVVGTFMSNYSSLTKRPAFGLSDAEIGFQSPVDPYARFDVLLHYASDKFDHGHAHADHEHGSGFEVEEALVTLTSLPYNLQLSGGRMRSKIGILNVVHLHDFNFIRYPNVITRYLGAEGLIADGVRASWLAPLPFWTEFIFEGQKTQTGEDTDYATGSLNLFFPFGEDAGLMLTGSGYYNKQNELNPLIPHHEDEHGHEHEDEGDHDDHEGEHEHEMDHFIEELIGDRDNDLNGYTLGARYKWQPITRALYRHFILQGEFMSRKLGDESYNGFYLMGEMKFTRGWTLGVMFEQTDVPEFHEHDEEFEVETNTLDGFSAALSYFPSHFQRVRLQYDHAKIHGENDNRLALQWTFLIGPHKPHAY